MSAIRNIRPWAGQLLGHARAIGHGIQCHFGGRTPLVATTSCVRFRQRSSVASVNLPPAKTGRAASQDERREFISVFPDVVRDLSEIGTHSDIPEAQKWYAKLQSFFLVADDIIDGSEMRRGRPAWYRKDDLGLSAFNDAILLEAGIYKLLHQHFREEPYYVDVLELFHEMTLKTALGQCLDLMSCPAGGRPVLSKFTMERYDAIVKYKTAYYSFYLPVALAMYMAGIRNTDNVRVADITDRELHRQARTILVEMGHFFQVQDDYLDCFGDPSVTGKVGTDIAEGKCTWLSVVALQRATPAQRALMEQHYGNPEEESVNKVRALYKELGLPATYRAYEDSTSSMIRVHIQQISRGLNHNVFFKFLDKIHKRSS